MTDSPAPRQPWCRGLLVDGPDAGREVQAVRRIGSTVSTKGGTYRVVDDEPEVVLLNFVTSE